MPIIVSLFALFAVLSSGQTQPGPVVATCRTADLDRNVEMSDPRGDDVSIVFYFKNISDHPCAFRESPEVRGPGGELRMGSLKLPEPVIVTPAGTAEEVVEFHSSMECPALSWLEAPIAFAPGSIHVCPPMRVSAFRLMAPGDRTPSGSVSPQSLTLSSELDTIFIDNAIRLRITRSG